MSNENIKTNPEKIVSVMGITDKATKQLRSILLRSNDQQLEAIKMVVIAEQLKRVNRKTANDLYLRGFLEWFKQQ